MGTMHRPLTRGFRSSQPLLQKRIELVEQVLFSNELHDEDGPCVVAKPGHQCPVGTLGQHVIGGWGLRLEGLFRFFKRFEPFFQFGSCYQENWVGFEFV